MDELRAFYNNPSGKKVVRLKGPQTCGRRLTKDDPDEGYSRKEEHRHTAFLTGTDYVKEVQDREQSMIYLAEGTSVAGGLESMEHLSSMMSIYQNPGLSQEDKDVMIEVYQKYSFQMKENTTNLAINGYKKEILSHLQILPVVIIEGPTGCGKTTQVPQWILDDAFQNRRHCKIIVTQPRRIAAISIAKRVAQERGWNVGELVGYQVGLDSKTSNDTRISYVTTGVLLQKLVASKTLNEYTHIILDEVHERGQEMDFLLLVVKKLLLTTKTATNIILMSATIKSSQFADYFKIRTQLGSEPAKCIHIEKSKQIFTVKTFYLDSLTKLADVTSIVRAKESPGIDPEMFKLVIKLLNAFDNIDRHEDDYSDDADVDIPSVLIFLPGINEIEELYGMLTNTHVRNQVAGPECAKLNWFVLPLHSTITADEQVRVFQRAPPGARKIILSTNIAESSITVPDIKYVIDFCLMKVLVANDETNFTALEMRWASKSNCEQRAGRAGRVRDGRVYRLVQAYTYECFEDECPPEIKRCPLERLVLLSKTLEMGPPTDILALAMDPPDLANIHRTVLVLKEIGALKKTVGDEYHQVDGDLTYLGRIMAKLPLDVRVSKLIMLGYIMGCLEEAIIMAAAMSVKNVFSSPFRERLNAYNSKLTWADGSTSDSIAFLNVYRVWNHMRLQQYFNQQGNNEFAWARRFFVQVRALRELDDLVREIKLRLSREGIEPHKGAAYWNKYELPLALKVIIAGAFYPHYFIQPSDDGSREREAVRALGGHDPRTTVYLQNFPAGQPGELYAATIKKTVQQLILDEPTVTFDGNTSKIYLSFDDKSRQSANAKANTGNPNIPGRVVLPVYKAVKARHLKMEFRLALLPLDKANAVSEALKLSKLSIDKDRMVPNLPAIEDTYFPLKISHLIDVGHFFAQYNDESTASCLEQIYKALNQRPLLAHTGVVTPGDLFAAPYQDASGSHMYRVRVHKLLPKDIVWVFYIDYGGYGRVGTCNLRVLPSGVCKTCPPLAIECVLAEVAPVVLLDAHQRWSSQALQHFRGLVDTGDLFAKVYSVAHGVVSIELMPQGGKINVNKSLIEHGFAQPCEESYESKLNHDLRETVSQLSESQKRAYNKQQTELAYQKLTDFEPPNAKDCVSDVLLKGPFSPLESSLRNLMLSSREKQVTVEWSSVNSVLLDTDPQDVHDRLLVAGVVSTNEMADKLTLRHTTLMPNIRGLPALMALLFCPQCELRSDRSKVRYVSALCGLGCDEINAPVFPEHDLLVSVDVDLDIDDMKLINHIRHLMDFMMYCGPGQDQPNMDDESRYKVPVHIRADLLKLLGKRWKRYESESVPGEWTWNSVPPEDRLEMIDDTMAEYTTVFPLHLPLELRERTTDELMMMKKHNDELVMLVNRPSTSAKKELTCKLCGTEAMAASAMRIHLYSRFHREKEEYFNIFQS